MASEVEEIEAILRDQIVIRRMGEHSFMEGFEEAAAAIAALRAQDREGGEQLRTRLIAWLSEHEIAVGNQTDREMTADALIADFIAPRTEDREGAREIAEFRVGRRMPRNVYRGDDGICMARTESEAAEMVALLNAGRLALAEQEARDA